MLAKVARFDKPKLSILIQKLKREACDLAFKPVTRPLCEAGIAAFEKAAH